MAPTTSRSASISSASTSTSKCSADGIKKKFGCSFPGCGKSFSRSEHLHRHALNHKEGNNTCLRCSAHFRRRDLLDRHMARHKEKDDEAGGEGLGVLATRKRLWRDTDGKIVNSRRPSYTADGAKRRQLIRPERKLSKASSSSSSSSTISLCDSSIQSQPMMRNHSNSSSAILVDTNMFSASSSNRVEMVEKPDLSDPDWLSIPATGTAPLSDAEPSPTTSELSEFDALYEDTTWSLQDHSIPTTHTSTSISSSTSSSSLNSPTVSTRQHEYPPPSWSPQPFQTFMGAMAELPYDDIFKPEAGLYDWQAWNSQVLMSKCREEKYDPLFAGEERVGKRELDGGSWRRGLGLGAC